MINDIVLNSMIVDAHLYVMSQPKLPHFEVVPPELSRSEILLKHIGKIFCKYALVIPERKILQYWKYLQR